MGEEWLRIEEELFNGKTAEAIKFAGDLKSSRMRPEASTKRFAHQLKARLPNKAPCPAFISQ